MCIIQTPLHELSTVSNVGKFVVYKLK
ncbi:hypothetical protein AC4HA13_0031 [Escherichia phage vB_EcoM_4HA13]|uniref:Uncharacterized protein n=1 Tax=Escherichia phage vB_EcoM_4HA13 TaxID=2601675 RepID=A0A8F4TDJ7_9CAUD|nr:hypothetical protein HYP96_gp31 [Escherichia phage vB_EcoM_4HA13]QXG07485.1 hypothetical protein AC4HA13_0031 [Escherichia phage vB_EcoM_4HA13]